MPWCPFRALSKAIVAVIARLNFPNYEHPVLRLDIGAVYIKNLFYLNVAPAGIRNV